MVMSRRKEVPKCHLMVNGEFIKEIEQFSYWASILASNGKWGTEIKRRIGIAKEGSEPMEGNQEEFFLMRI